MNKIKLKVIEWNLHGMTGFNGKGQLDYHFPSKLIIENIDRLKPDIIVFTEFCSFRFRDGWNDQKSDKVTQSKKDVEALSEWFKENNYTLLYSTYNDGITYKNYNDVGIAIKTKKQNTTIKCEKKRGKKWPDYLGVCCENEQSSFYVMGVRIQTSDGSKKDIDNRKEQFRKVIKEINIKKKIMPVIVLGDFNNGAGQKLYDQLCDHMKEKCKNDLHIYTPGVFDSGDKLKWDFGVFSYTYRNSLMKIDHMITSFDAKISDLRYDWGFIGDVYNNFRNYNIANNSFRNIPDHAIFYAEITLPENY